MSCLTSIDDYALVLSANRSRAAWRDTPLANTGLACAHAVDGLCKGAQVKRHVACDGVPVM